MEESISTAANESTETGSRPTSSEPLQLNNSKQRRKLRHGRYHGVQDEQIQCYLTRLPMEIIAEVLSYTTPRDILALARSNKFFCATLVDNPSSAFIWKKSRSRCLPEPIPDPTPNFTEASYAAFLFDSGECEWCKKKTKAMYASFSLRLRLCNKVACRRNWRNGKAIEVRLSDVSRYRLVAERLPRAEIRSFGYNSAHLEGLLDVMIPSLLTFRRSQWQAAVDDYNRIALNPAALKVYQSEQAVAVERITSIMQHGMRLVRWRILFDEQTKVVRECNLTSARGTAESNNWPLWDLMQTPSYGTLFHSKNRSLELIVPRDFDLIRPSVESEIAQIIETRKRREEEAAYRKRRADVAQYYDDLKVSGQGGEILPTLPVFRTLPVMQVMQNKMTSKPKAGISRDFKSALVTELVNQNLSQWQDSAKADFAVLLGTTSGKSAGRNKLHAVDRLNARFRCKKCDAHGQKGPTSTSMSFAEACQHRCPWLSKKQKGKETWKAENFCVDAQAVKVVDQLLMWCGVDAGDAEALQAVNKLGTRILCMSCTSAIVMDYEMMLRHCSRHDEMHIKLLSPSQVDEFIQHPVERGLFAQLTERSLSPQSLREKRIYGCRHCQQVRSSDIPTEAAGAPEAALSVPEHVSRGPTPAESSSNVKEKTRGSQPKAGQGKPLKMYTFDGLRSHVKEKHGIPWMGDEDFYRETVQDICTSHS